MGNPPLWPTLKKRGDAYKQTTPLFCPPLRRSRMTGWPPDFGTHGNQLFWVKEESEYYEP